MKNRIQHIKIKKNSNQKNYFKPLKYPEIPLSINDLYVVASIGDRLDLLAFQFYGDSRLWWIIASANMGVVNRDSYSLKPGTEIRIPSDYQNILDDFEEINS
jgi:nucleoid-associated protein YgaU